jgi:hypothetical protein
MEERTYGRAGDQSRRDLELRLTGLLFAHAILEQRGASQAELDGFSREAAYVRWRLASRNGADAAA